MGPSRNISITSIVYRNADPIFISAATEVAAVDQACAIGSHFRNIGITSPPVECQIRSNRLRESGFGRIGSSGDIGITGAVYRNVVARVSSATADVAAVDQHRWVYDQLAAPVILAKCKPIAGAIADCRLRIAAFLSIQPIGRSD